MSKLKSEVLKLLREDEEFRYAVAGLIGLEEILKRLDKHGQELVKLRQDMNKVLERLDRHEQELIRLRQDMNKVLERLDRHEDVLRRHEQELIRLRQDMNRGFELVNRHISALGARWGLMSEKAFRDGLRGVLERELGLKVERWSCFDEDGLVYGYPSEVEIDVVVKDEKTILVEVASHIKTSDIYEFKRKAMLYEKVTGIKPSKLLVVTPFIEPKALEAAKKHNVEVYTGV